MRKVKEEATGKRMPKNRKNRPTRSSEGAAPAPKIGPMIKGTRVETRGKAKAMASKNNTLTMRQVTIITVKVSSVKAKTLIARIKTGREIRARVVITATTPRKIVTVTAKTSITTVAATETENVIITALRKTSDRRERPPTKEAVMKGKDTRIGTMNVTLPKMPGNAIRAPMRVRMKSRRAVTSVTRRRRTVVETTLASQASRSRATTREANSVTTMTAPSATKRGDTPVRGLRPRHLPTEGVRARTDPKRRAVTIILTAKTRLRRSLRSRIDKVGIGDARAAAATISVMTSPPQ